MPVRRTLRSLTIVAFLDLLREAQESYQTGRGLPEWADEAEFFWITTRNEVGPDAGLGTWLVCDGAVQCSKMDSKMVHAGVGAIDRPDTTQCPLPCGTRVASSASCRMLPQMFMVTFTRGDVPDPALASAVLSSWDAQETTVYNTTREALQAGLVGWSAGSSEACY